MKKLITFALVFVMLASVLSGCKKASGLYYDYDMSKYVTLGKYSKTVDRESDDYKEAYQTFYSDIFGSDLAYETDEGYLELGDTANINYKGLHNGEAFEGGTSSNYDLTLGSGVFIDGFEDGLVGKKIGSTVNLNLTFPKGYQNEELAGEDVVFVVTINFATKLAEPTEEDAVNYGFDSLSDYKKQADDFAVGVSLFYNIVDASTIKSYPKKEEKALLESAIAEYESYCASQNTDLETMLSYQGTTVSEFESAILEQEIRPYMRHYLVANLLLQNKDAKLTKEDVEKKRNELDEKYDETLESLGYDSLEIQHTAAFSKIIKILQSEAKVIN